MFHRKYIIFIALICFLILSGWFAMSWQNKDTFQETSDDIWQDMPLPDIAIDNRFEFEEEREAKDIVSDSDSQNTDSTKKNAVSVMQKVFFTSQAPFGEWSNEIFQNACEEASMLMAMAWVRGETFSPDQVKRTILDMHEFERRMFGREVLDTSTEDTARTMKEYYRYENIQVKHDISLEDIKTTLQDNVVIIVPADGRALHNPNFTQPGPEHHMLVIIGYDAKTKEFITNDPGTRKGKSYRYNERVLYGAIRDYPTGNHELITGNTKSMIVIGK